VVGEPYRLIDDEMTEERRDELALIWELENRELVKELLMVGSKTRDFHGDE